MEAIHRYQLSGSLAFQPKEHKTKWYKKNEGLWKKERKKGLQAQTHQRV